MDLGTILPSGSYAATLRCFVCENYLSYFPVSVCSNNRSICGRCVLPEGITSLRDVAFETVVQFLRLPCRYQSVGCFEDLQPEDVPQHEGNCPWRIVNCIVNDPRRCEWSGSLPTLTDHYQNEHSDIFLRSEGFEMDLTRSMESQHVMKVDDKLFIFWKSFDFESKILQFAVYLHDYETDVGSYGCHLSISSGETTISHNFGTTSFEEKVFEAVGLLFAKKDIGNQDLVTIRMSLRKKEIVNENGILEDKAKDSKMRDLLKCSNCHTFAGPSIFRDAVFMTVLCADCNFVSIESSKKLQQSNKTKGSTFNFGSAFTSIPSTESSKQLQQSNTTEGSTINFGSAFTSIPSNESSKQLQQSNTTEGSTFNFGSAFTSILSTENSKQLQQSNTTEGSTFNFGSAFTSIPSTESSKQLQQSSAAAEGTTLNCGSTLTSIPSLIESSEQLEQWNKTEARTFNFGSAFASISSSTESSKQLQKTNKTGGRNFVLASVLANNNPCSTNRSKIYINRTRQQAAISTMDPVLPIFPSSAENSKKLQQPPNKIEDKILSAFAALLTYPCKFQEYGCIYTAHLEELKNHEDLCQYRREVCMFEDCLWEGTRKDIENHVLQKHSNSVIDLELLGETIVSKDDPKCYIRILKFCNRLFYLSFLVLSDLFCSVEKITICKQEFNFEIEIADAMEPTDFHLVRLKCEQLNKQEYCGCYFPNEQVFGKLNKGKFKVRIFKTL